MKSTCCRSTPRCAGCPVLVRAAARRHAHHSIVAGLVSDVLAGHPGRPLPPGVAEALARLDAAVQRGRTARLRAGEPGTGVAA